MGDDRAMHEQNMAIVKSLVSVAWADGDFADAERQMIDGLLAGFDASEDEANEIRAYAAEKRTLEDIPLSDLSADDRRILLQHAVLLSFVDGAQADSEKAMIDALRARLRIPEAESTAIVQASEERAKRLLSLL